MDFSSAGKKAFARRTSQINAEAEKEFFICVHLRDLRASLDSVAAGRAVLSVAK
jgi:hypothetical protein